MGSSILDDDSAIELDAVSVGSDMPVEISVMFFEQDLVSEGFGTSEELINMDDKLRSLDPLAYRTSFLFEISGMIVIVRGIVL